MSQIPLQIVACRATLLYKAGIVTVFHHEYVCSVKSTHQAELYPYLPQMQELWVVTSLIGDSRCSVRGVPHLQSV